MYSSKTFYSRSLNKFGPNTSYNFYQSAQKKNSSFLGTKPLTNVSHSSSYTKPLSSSAENHYETDLPSQLLSMIQNEESNISNFKRKIEHQKKKIEEDFYHFKKQIEHLIDDSKLSLQAQLDQLYVGYMEKYACLKNQIQDLRIHRKQILLENPSNSRLGKPKKVGKSEIISQIQEDIHYSRQHEARSYLGQVQKSRMNSINSLTDQLLIIDSFTVPLYNKQNMFHKMETLKISLIDNLQEIHQNKNLVNTIDNILLRGLQKEAQTNLYQSHVVKDQNYLRNLNNFNQNRIQGLKQSKANKSFQNQNISIPISQKNAKKFLEPQFNESFQGTSHFQHLNQKAATKQTTQQNKQSLFVSRVSNISSEGHIQINSNQQGFITDEKLTNLSLNHLGTFSTDHRDAILCAVFIDGQIATGSKDKTINIYDMQGRKLRTLTGHQSSVCCMSVVETQYGQYLATGSDHGCSSIIFWNPNNWTMKFKKQYHSAALSGIVDMQDRNHIVTTSYDKKVCLFNYSKVQIESCLNCYNSPIISCAITSDQTKIITVCLDKSIGIIGIVKSYNRVQYLQPLRSIYCEALPCALQTFINQPKMFAVGTKDGKILVFQTDNGNLIHESSIVQEGPIVSLNLLESSLAPYQLVFTSSVKSSGIMISNLKENKNYSLPIEGKVNLEFGCGIGPKIIFDTFGRVLIVNQGFNTRSFSIYKFNKNRNIVRPWNELRTNF